MSARDDMIAEQLEALRQCLFRADGIVSAAAKAARSSVDYGIGPGDAKMLYQALQAASDIIDVPVAEKGKDEFFFMPAA